jgi:hypothetical protein
MLLGTFIICKCLVFQSELSYSGERALTDEITL